MTAAADAVFRWHPEASARDAAGDPVPRAARFQPVIPDRPAGAALAAALAGQGRAFRIGGAGDPPRDGPAPAFETLTGGSTGTPRRIRRAQASWTASFAVNAGLMGIGPGRRVAVLGRLVHSLALYGALEALHRGAALHLLESLRPDRQRAELARRGIDVLYATPAQLRLLVEAGGPPLPTLALVLVGGARLEPDLRASLRRMAPQAVLRVFYGAAETSFITMSDDTTPKGAVGAPYPGVRIDLRPSAGQGDAVTEVWVQSPYLFETYAGPAGSARWDAGWLSVGDVGRIAAGALVLSGRAGRMVKIADQAVHPEDIEAFLLARPGVLRAAVLTRPDPRRGHHLIACVQSAESDDSLISALRAAFGPLVAPRAILRVQDWPVLASGKTDLARLAEVAR